MYKFHLVFWNKNLYSQALVQSMSNGGNFLRYLEITLRCHSAINILSLFCLCFHFPTSNSTTIWSLMRNLCVTSSHTFMCVHLSRYNICKCLLMLSLPLSASFLLFGCQSVKWWSSFNWRDTNKENSSCYLSTNIFHFLQCLQCLFCGIKFHVKYSFQFSILFTGLLIISVCCNVVCYTHIYIFLYIFILCIVKG